MRRLLVSVFLLSACDMPSTPDKPTAVAPPPAQLCDQAGKALEQLKAKAAIDYDDKGEATIMQDAWMRMSAGEHSQFAHLLALHATCAKPDGAAERQVRIRNESGIILLENKVQTTIDLGAAD